MTMTFPEFSSNAGFVEDANVLAAQVMPHRPGVYRNVFKRILDVTAIIMAAPVVVPVVAGLALLVARDGG